MKLIERIARAAGLAMLALSACQRDERAPTNVVVLVASALRADAVGCYGGAALTPTIDELARGGVRFDAAYASAPWLAPSVASMLTGRRPSEHGFQNIDGELSSSSTTLAQVLATHGYATHAVVSDFLVGPARGVSRGFASVEQIHRPQGSSSGEVAAAASAFLTHAASSAQPFFLLAHFADAAAPFVRHEEDGGAPRAVGELDGDESLDYLRVSSADMTAAEREFVRELALGEVREVDRAIERVLATLRERGLAKRTLVIVVGSHGYEWFERGWIGDGHALHEELVRVPWILRLPGAATDTRVVSEPVSTAALAPTVLELCHFPPQQLGGSLASLAPRLRGDARATASPVVLEVDFDPPLSGVRERIAHARGIVWDGFKLVRDRSSGATELFDLRADPGESRDLSRELPKHVRTLAPYLEPARVASTRVRVP